MNNDIYNELIPFDKVYSNKISNPGDIATHKKIPKHQHDRITNKKDYTCDNSNLEYSTTNDTHYKSDHEMLNDFCDDLDCSDTCNDSGSSIDSFVYLPKPLYELMDVSCQPCDDVSNEDEFEACVDCGGLGCMEQFDREANDNIVPCSELINTIRPPPPPPKKRKKNMKKIAPKSNRNIDKKNVIKEGDIFQNIEDCFSNIKNTIKNSDTPINNTRKNKNKKCTKKERKQEKKIKFTTKRRSKKYSDDEVNVENKRFKKPHNLQSFPEQLPSLMKNILPKNVLEPIVNAGKKIMEPLIKANRNYFIGYNTNSKAKESCKANIKVDAPCAVKQEGTYQVKINQCNTM